VIWLSLRTQRTETLIAAALVALVAAALTPSGLHMLSVYHHDGLAGCAGSASAGGCDDLVHSFTNQFESLRNALGWLTLAPGLIGVLLAAPTILELEHETHRLAWTQSITRRRWVTSKLATAAATAAVAAVALIVFLTWWHGPLDRLQGRLDAGSFDSEGTVAVGYTLFALGLGLAIGAVWRRVTPALVVAFAAYVALRVFVDTWLRQRFAAPLAATWSMRQSGPDLHRARVLTEYPSNRFGQHILLKHAGDACLRKLGGVVAAPADGHCKLARLAQYTHAVYQPASRFWLFQGIETAMFGGAALVLIAFAAWWIHERTS